MHRKHSAFARRMVVGYEKAGAVSKGNSESTHKEIITPTGEDMHISLQVTPSLSGVISVEGAGREGGRETGHMC